MSALRALTYALAAVVLLSCSGPSPARDPIVVILRDGLPVCSGFAVGRTQIVTAAHCLDGARTVAFATAEQWRTTAKAFTVGHVTVLDVGRDLAAFESDAEFAEPLRMRSPLLGETVTAESVMFGRQASGVVLPGLGFYRDTTISVDFGWSGSPVLGADGRVVGFVHACTGRLSEQGRIECRPNTALIGVMP